MNQQPHTSPHRNGGYVLLLILLLLPVVATATARICLLSMNAARDASQSQTDLQQRWGMQSCRAALWPYAIGLIDQANEQADEPVYQVHLSIAMGNQHYELLFADEQAKLNLNAVYQRRGPRLAQQYLEALIGHDNDLRARIHLQPRSISRSETADAWTPPFGSWGHVFRSPTPQQLTSLPGTPAPAPGSELGGSDWNGTKHTSAISADSGNSISGGHTSGGHTSGGHTSGGHTSGVRASGGGVTLWGSGHVNFRRASREVLERACSPILGVGQIEQLVNLRHQQPGIDLHTALDRLDITLDQRRQLINLLTDRSDCTSMWISGYDGRRRWDELHVSMAGAGSQAIVFRW